mgnify:CR=1 FL=1
MDIRRALLSIMGRNEDDEPSNGRPSRLAQASQDFQTRWNGAARDMRQRLPSGVVGALAHSGIPGWEGMSRERNAQDARDFGLESPTNAPVSPTLRTALRDALTGGDLIGAETYSAPIPGVAHGMAPPDGPQGPPQAQLDNQAFLDARTRARAAIAQEGTPYLDDPNVQASGQALAAAVDQNRASQDELRRRQGVSWDDWWHFGGRQAGVTDPSLPAYRFGRAPPRYRAESRRPGPR